MKKIAILGSTGSIGTQTLEVVRENRDIEVTALAAGSNIGLLEAQIRKFHPVLAAVWDEAKAKELRENVKDLDVKVVSGMDGLIEVAVQQDAEILVKCGEERWDFGSVKSLTIPGIVFIHFRTWIGCNLLGILGGLHLILLLYVPVPA